MSCGLLTHPFSARTEFHRLADYKKDWIGNGNSLTRWSITVSGVFVLERPKLCTCPFSARPFRNGHLPSREADISGNTGDSTSHELLGRSSWLSSTIEVSLTKRSLVSILPMSALSALRTLNRCLANVCFEPMVFSSGSRSGCSIARLDSPNPLDHRGVAKFFNLALRQPEIG